MKFLHDEMNRQRLLRQSWNEQKQREESIKLSHEERQRRAQSRGEE